MREKSADRLVRLLALLGYLGEHGRVSVAELAAQFGVTPEQIVADVNLLWVAGTPGYYPSDLIDLSLDEDSSWVELLEDQGLGRPVRLAPREAAALAAAVEWLAATGEVPPAAAAPLESLRGKLRALAPAAVAPEPAPAVAAQVRDAVGQEAALEIRYVSAADDVTQRVILPERISTDGAGWYTQAWCALAGARRTFRLDRILECRPATPEQTAAAKEARAAAPALADALRRVVIEVAPEDRWLVEEIPGRARELKDGSWRLTLTTGKTEWLVRLALGTPLRAASADVAALVRERAAQAAATYAAWPDTLGEIRGKDPS